MKRDRSGSCCYRQDKNFCKDQIDVTLPHRMVQCHVIIVVFILLTCRQDSSNFGIENPEFSVVDEVESDLKKHENMWSLFDEFNTGNLFICRN
jgi:hypothetical protein